MTLKQVQSNKNDNEVLANEQTIQRIEDAENNGVIKHKFEEFATEEDIRIAKEVKDWDITDEELFE